MVFIPHEIHSQRMNFSASGYQLAVASGWGNSLCQLFFSKLGCHLEKTHAGSAHVASFIIEHVWVDHDVFFHLVTSVLSDSNTPSTLSSMGFHEHWGEGHDGNICLGLGVLILSFSAHCVCIFPIYWRRKLLWWWLGKPPVYEQSRMPLEVIL